MSYQSKNYKKFLASSMTAAMVAAAVAPSAGFAASNFTDVPADNFYFDFVTALADAKIIDGRPDGSFDLGGKINRAEASKMVANILKLDTTNAPAADFSDVDQDVWYAEYINALYDADLIDGKGKGKFDPKGTLTRGEFAKMVVEAYNLKLNENGPSANFTDVDEDAWYAEYVNILFSHNLVTGTTSTTFSPKAEIKRADFAKLLTETDWEKGSTLEKPAPAAAAVEGVTGVNAKTIEVKFTKAVDAETIDAITLIKGEEASNPGTVTQQLSEDGKTLTLKAANIFKGDYTVKVPFEAVKDTEGNFVSPTNAAVTVNDTAAPVLEAASTTVKDKDHGIANITLTFDEEVSSIETVKVAGSNYDAVVNGNKATVAVNIADATKAYDVTVVNAEDAAGNVKDVQTTSLDVTVDDVAPSIVGVEAIGENQVKVTVDEELAGDALAITGKVGTYTANIVSDIEVNEDNNKEFIVTLNNEYLFKNGNSDSVTLTVAEEAIADALGNKNAKEINKTVVVSKDTSAPEAVEVKTSKTDGKVTSFTVTYNEEVTVADASKISVVNGDGEILSHSNVIASAVVDNKDAKKVVFTLVNGLEVNEYNIKLAKGFAADKALAPNASEEYSFSVDVTEDSAPVETSFEIVGAEAVDNVITVDFGAKVKATGKGSALDADAYTVNGKTLPSDTEIAFGKDANGNLDQTTVEITLPAGFVAADDNKAVFKVTGVETLDNKESLPFTETVAITDNKAPEAEEIVATELTKVTVTFSEAIQIAALQDGTPATISDEIKLLDKNGAEISFSEYEVTEDGELVLTVVDSSLVSKLVTNEVEAAAADIKDAAGNGQKAGVTVNK